MKHTCNQKQTMYNFILFSSLPEQFPQKLSAPVATRSPNRIENGFLRQLFRRLPTVALLLLGKN